MLLEFDGRRAMQKPRSVHKIGAEARHRTPDDFRAILNSDQAGGGRSGGGKASLAAVL